ncbi:MAG TPA: hypothetical protein PKK32_01790, partial [Candidatus Paceibacterota bacterium]|nr:hypothetical protein [Candidatus Paceibacterota bacterium]
MEEKKLKKLILLKEEPSLAIFDELEEIQENLEPIKESLVGIDFIKGEPGENGKDGKDGKDGYTPIKGIDYFDGKDGRDGKDGKDGYTPIKGKDYFDGKDGKDGRDGLDGLKGEKGDKPRHKWEGTKLRFENPDGKWGQAVDLKGETGRAFIGYGGGGSNVRVKNDGTLISDNPVKFLNFKGTGLDSISNDGNGQVTITVNDSQDLSGYLKLDQSTPQTTIGRFNFPNLAVDTDTIYTKDGNVGIGTTAPNQQLEITKNFRLPAT